MLRSSRHLSRRRVDTLSAAEDRTTVHFNGTEWQKEFQIPSGELNGNAAWVTDLSSPLFADELFICFGIQQQCCLISLCQLHLDHPAFTIGVLVHNLGRILDLLVHFRHLAGERRIEVRYGLDGFDGTK